MKNLILFATGCILLFACAPVEEPMTADDKAQIGTTIGETFDLMIEDMLAGENEKVLPYNLFDENFSIVMDGNIIMGGEKAEEMFKSSFDYIQEYHYLKTPQKEIIVYDRSTGMVIFRFDESYSIVTGDTLKVNGSATYLYKLIEDQWKIVHVSGFHNMGE
jgi:hypothetical protein